MRNSRFRHLLVALLLLPALLGLGRGFASPAGADGNEAVGAPVAARSISAGSNFVCAILHDATVKCWGGNGAAQLGLGGTASRGDNPNEMGAALPRVPLGSGRTVTALATGNAHACAVLDTGVVKCWGANTTGQLGLGNTDLRGVAPGGTDMGDNLPTVSLGAGRTATAITAGGGHTCALLDNGAVKCWGANNSGQAGQGHTNDIGDNPNEMGDNLQPVDLGGNHTAIAVSATSSHTCALLDNGTVKCWGFGSGGRLGQGSNANIGTAANQMGDNLPPIALGTDRTATAISAGNAQSCAVLDNGQVKCWGANNNAELGTGNLFSYGDHPNEMGENLPPVSLGTDRTAVAVSTHNNHTCALLDNSTVKCWGTNANGQLGQGSTATLGDGPNELGDSMNAIALGANRTAVAVTTGNNFTCAVLDNSSVKCWGANASGQLATGNTNQLGDGTNEMGDNLLAIDLDAAVVPAAALSVTLTADETAVTAGATIHYHLTVSNTGGLPLTGLAVAYAKAPDCDGALPDLAIGAIQVSDCNYPTTAADIGVYSNEATVDSDQTSPVSTNGVDVTVNPVPPVVHTFQPDALIRIGTGAPAGDGILNTTAVGQTRSKRVGNRGAVTFTVRIDNQGTAPDTFRLAGPGSTRRFTVTYRSGVTNITTGVRAGTARITNVPAGASRNVTITIRARRGTPHRAAVSRILRVTSQTNGRADAVKATVIRR